MQFLKECCDIQGDCVICSFSVFDGTPWPLCEMAKTYAEIAIFWRNSKNRVPKLLFDRSGRRNGKNHRVELLFSGKIAKTGCRNCYLAVPEDISRWPGCHL